MIYLKGKYGACKGTAKDMESASEEMNFERAAVLRDQLHAVQSVQQRQNIVSKEGDFDVVGMSRLDEHAGLEIFIYVTGNGGERKSQYSRQSS